MKYVFDANILIRSSRIGFAVNEDEFNGFLDWVFSLIEKGVIVLPECVFNKISGDKDTLAQWCKVHVKEYKIDDSIAAPYLQKVLEAYEAADVKTIEAIGSDAFIIAHALACGGTVVTYEKESRATSALYKKIPSICEKLGIPCITLPAFLRKFKGHNS